MPQHLLNSFIPLPSKACRKLLGIFSFWDLTSPHLWFCGFTCSVGFYHLAAWESVKALYPKPEGDILIPHLNKYQPCIIPTTIALRIGAHPVLGIIQCVATERIIPSQTTELTE